MRHSRTLSDTFSIVVSKIGHCLNDLLFRASTGQLPVNISLIVSNHPDFKHLAEVYKVPFHHIPVNKDIKPQAEQEVLDLIKQHEVELVVLARYMQVMSANFCEKAVSWFGWLDYCASG